VLLPLQWWPEWRITVDAVDVAYASQSGLVAVDLDQGTFAIGASLERSHSRWAAAPLSVGGIAALLFLLRFRGRDDQPSDQKLRAGG
jgi:hypothetical protein